MEAHIAAVAIGGGKAYYQGRLLDGADALAVAGLSPIELSYKEGLVLVSGITASIALSALAVQRLEMCAKVADIAAAISVEALKGEKSVYDPELMKARAQKEQIETADNLLRMLAGSDITGSCKAVRVQDALSLRCVPQAHGAAKKTIRDAARAVTIDINSCCDNPIVVPQTAELRSNGNPDAAYEGIEMDSCCMAAAYLAKISERRTARYTDYMQSGYPAYLTQDPWVNSGIMITQYSQAGLLNELKILSTPACVDSIPTAAGQEDYVAMGYNSALKALRSAERLEYILAIELFSGYQAQQFIPQTMKRGAGTEAALAAIATKIPVMKEDYMIHPQLEKLKSIIHDGTLIREVEKTVGKLN